MKKLLFILVLFSQYIMAQTTISNAYFPTVGDTLKINIANAATARLVKIAPAGGNQVWDYSFLRSTNATMPSYTEQYGAPDSATLAAFGTADVVRNLTNVGQKEVYNKTNTRFELIGYQGFTLGFLNLPIKPVFGTPVLERRATLTYNSTNNNSSSFIVPLPLSLIPDTLLSSLPIRPDSMRLKFQTDRKDKVDGWGQLRIAGGNYDVLRERRLEVSETKVEARVANFIWIDITGLFGGARPPKDTTLSYYFWSNVAKEPIAMVQFRNETDTLPSRVEYKFLNFNTKIQETDADKLSVILYPNPAKNSFFVKINHCEPTTYEMKINNLVGQVVATKKANLASGDTVPFDLSLLTSGTYILTINTEGGKMLYSEKIIRE